MFVCDGDKTSEKTCSVGEKQPWLKQREAFKPPVNRPSPKYPRTVMNTLRRRDAACRPRTHARTCALAHANTFCWTLKKNNSAVLCGVPARKPNMNAPFEKSGLFASIGRRLPSRESRHGAGRNVRRSDKALTRERHITGGRGKGGRV